MQSDPRSDHERLVDAIARFDPSKPLRALAKEECRDAHVTVVLSPLDGVTFGLALVAAGLQSQHTGTPIVLPADLPLCAANRPIGRMQNFLRHCRLTVEIGSYEEALKTYGRRSSRLASIGCLLAALGIVLLALIGVVATIRWLL